MQNMQKYARYAKYAKYAKCAKYAKYAEYANQNKHTQANQNYWFKESTPWSVRIAFGNIYFLQLQRKMAQAATLTIAQAFNLAFQVHSHTHIHKQSKRKT